MNNKKYYVSLKYGTFSGESYDTEDEARMVAEGIAKDRPGAEVFVVQSVATCISQSVKWSDNWEQVPF